MTKSKMIQAEKSISHTVKKEYQNIENAVVSTYKKIEKTVVDNYNKIEDKFIQQYLTHDGETIEEAKIRLKKEQENLKRNNK